MKYVLGIDLGTSAVKIVLLNQQGQVCLQVAKSYPLIQEKSGFSEQDPAQWVQKTTEAIRDLLQKFEGNVADIEGLSFSGQMHGLVLLDQKGDVLRPAILWNDTRTTEQCQDIYSRLGTEKLLQLTKNPALEGFTLPKLLWVKQYEPDIYEQADVFMLPKDYVRYWMTGQIYTDYSDAAGTLLLDIAEKKWSAEVCQRVGIDVKLCPPLVPSHACVGKITEQLANLTGLAQTTKVFAGGADNACGAIGAGILEEGKTLCSIGTSGVVLSYESRSDLDFRGKVHYFNHGDEQAFYTMGVTLAAGYSLQWFKTAFAPEETFEEMLVGLDQVPVGANGLLFTPYIVGERTPHADAKIRGSFIGVEATHRRIDFARAVIEGITFSLNETLHIFRENGKSIDLIVSIGGGAKNETWLQMQADIFNTSIVKLSSEQGPAMGAAMLAAYGCGWYPSLQACAQAFVSVEKTYAPIPENVSKYRGLFNLYQQMYVQTKDINAELKALSKG